MTPLLRRIALLLFAVEVAGIAWLVLNPSSATPTAAVLKVSAFLLAHGSPSWMASTTGWEYLLNVALFVPLGFLCAVMWERVSLGLWVIIGCAVSSALELTQLLVVDTRSASLSDVSSNTVGMFVGAAVASVVLDVVERRRTRKQPGALVYD